MIACPNTHSFVEEGENCASSISVEHLEPLFHTLVPDMALFGSNFKFQEPSVMLVVVLINFGVKNQVTQVSFKIVDEELMLVFSHEFVDIIFFESLVIVEYISYYGAQEVVLHSPRYSLPSYLITCSSPHRSSKYGDILHSPGQFLLTLGADFTSHGLMFKLQYISCLVFPHMVRILDHFFSIIN